jgi:hypothetical protein
LAYVCAPLLTQLAPDLCSAPQVSEGTKTNARNALRELVIKLGGGALVTVAVMEERMKVVAEQEAADGAVEAALRLVLVLTPHLEGASLERARSLVPALLRRALATKGPLLNNRLAARCVANLAKRGALEAAAGQAVGCMSAALRDMNDPESHPHAAHLLLEVRGPRVHLQRILCCGRTSMA